MLLELVTKAVKFGLIEIALDFEGLCDGLLTSEHLLKFGELTLSLEHIALRVLQKGVIPSDGANDLRREDLLHVFVRNTGA